MENNNKNIIDGILSSNPEIDKSAAKKAVESQNAKDLISKLSPDDKEKLNSILSDKEALKSVLSSPKAQMLLKMLSGGGKNG